jgi:WD40 repeat protein
MLGEPLKGHSNNVNAVAFNPDGTLLASGASDNSVLLWNVQTLQRSGSPLVGHLNQVTSIAFSPDGKILASGSTDNSIILWDVETGQPIGEPIQGNFGSLTSLRFNPVNGVLASGHDDWHVILWDLQQDSWIESICQRTGRNFSLSEWTQFFTSENYHSTCSQWEPGK